jgi:hypothetical protein
MIFVIGIMRPAPGKTKRLQVFRVAARRKVASRVAVIYTYTLVERHARWASWPHSKKFIFL